MLLYEQLNSSNDRPVRPETRIAVKRALADAVLTLSARVVMGYLLMDHPQAVKREKCPPLYVTAAALGLCTRTVQRAYDELEREGWLDDSRSGPDDLPDAAEEPERRRLLHQMPGDLPARRSPPASLPPPTLSQHIEGFEVLRERALAANKLGIALRAHIELGHSMGYARPKRASSPLPRPQTGEAGRGFDASMNVDGVDQPPPNLPRACPAGQAGGCPAQGRDQKEGQELALAGTEPAPAGSPLALSGSNWRELADLGGPGSADSGYSIKPINDLVWRDPAAQAPERLRADAEWEDYCRTRNAERARLGLDPDMPAEDCPLQLSSGPETDKFSTLERGPLAAGAIGPI